VTTRLLVAATLAALSGCASIAPHSGPDFEAHLASEALPVRSCAEWYRALDHAVDETGVRDAQFARVPGFPYLRVDRAHAAQRDRARSGEAALQALAERLLALDLEARRFEVDNLPAERVRALPGVAADLPRNDAMLRTRGCGRLLREIDVAKPAARERLLARASVPDDYSLAQRVLGLYPLLRIPFAAGVRRWEAEARAAFGQSKADPGVGRVRYAPPRLGPLPRDVVAGVLARARFDPLGQLQISEREVEVLAATYAPDFDVAVSSDADRPGALRWRRGAETPEVDAADPSVYFQLASTRYGDQVLVQLVYTLWFPERPPERAGDLLSGMLDGVVWRVTLAPDGEPIIYDSIHACGCYHMFFPTARARARPPPNSLDEWAFVPVALPRVAEGERPLVSVASGTHALDGVSLVRGRHSLVRYALRPYDELRSMMRLEGGRRSAFGPDGLIAGTERMERFVFWPMGIASAGAMRQWGRQPTAFVGRRHFDDADLLERRFTLELESAQ
jgi:hypothetical protein